MPRREVQKKEKKTKQLSVYLANKQVERQGCDLRSSGSQFTGEEPKGQGESAMCSSSRPRFMARYV